jgi:predicted PurR-regulated permease PerM
MSDSSSSHAEASTPDHHERASQVFEVVIRLGMVFLLLFWGLLIVAPFLHPLAWGAILAVALYPVFQKLIATLGGRPRLAGTLFIVASIALVIVPAGMLAASSMDGVKGLAERWQAGELRVPPPPEQVRELPVAGERLYEGWLEASTNLEATVRRFAPQLQAAGGLLLSLAASTGGVLLLLTFSLMIAGVLMIQGESCIAFASTLATRLVGDEGEEFLGLATTTIRAVAVGVIGTAAIQAAAAALGFVVMGIPLAGLWAALVLVLAVIQLPPLLVLLPIALWSYSSYDTLPASLFTVWCVLVAASDNLIKPILMGRGQDVPMLVLLIGSLGGMLLSGIMGLFVGAVVLAVIYRLFGAWLGSPRLA